MIDHPITPPPELFKQWEDDILNERDNVDHVLDCAWRDGFRAGADQELEACCQYIGSDGKWFANPEHRLAELRTARRPSPPSLAEEAHDALSRFFSNAHTQASQMTQDFEILRHAVQRLQELENNG